MPTFPDVDGVNGPDAIALPKALAAILQGTGGAPPARLWGRGGGVLYFMRSADCPLCGLHVRKLEGRAADFAAADIAITVVVPDSLAGAREVGERVSAPFTVVYGNGAHAEVGLQRVLFNGLQQSGTIVVDGAGTILRRRFASLPFGAFEESDLGLVLPTPVAGVVSAT